MRKLIVLLVVAVVGIGLPAVAARATTLSSLVCGQMITTSVRLAHDVNCPGGFRVAATGPVIIDLHGHTLTTGSWYLGDTAVTLRSGTLDGSLTEYTFALTADLTINDLHVTGNVYLFGGGGNVRNSTVDGWVSLSGETDIVSHDLIRGGVLGDDGEFGGLRTIEDSHVVGGINLQELDFTVLDLAGRITGNLVTGSPGAGIFVGGVDDFSFLVARNVVTGNAGDGIRVGRHEYQSLAKASQVTVKRNLVTNNGAHGIEILPGPKTVIDGGHNIASGNALDPQCIGVVCKP